MHETKQEGGGHILVEQGLRISGLLELLDHISPPSSDHHTACSLHPDPCDACSSQHPYRLDHELPALQHIVTDCGARVALTDGQVCGIYDGFVQARACFSGD